MTSAFFSNALRDGMTRSSSGSTDLNAQLFRREYPNGRHVIPVGITASEAR
jgi:hypothetical protein